MAGVEKLLSRQFILLNCVFLFASAVMAVFFQFHEYLHLLGIDPKWYGFIIGADSLASFILQPVISPFLSAGNARRWMVAGITGMIAALILYKTAVTVSGLVIIRMVHGAGFVCFVAAMMAMIVDYIPEQKSGQAFGLISLVRLIPYALVPPIVSLSGDTPEAFLIVLRYCALLMALSVVMLFFVTGRSPEGQKANDPRRTSLEEILQDIKNWNVLILFIVNLFLYSGYTITFFYLKGFGDKISIANPGFFFTIATLAMIGIRLIGGRLFDRVNKVYFTACALAGLGICYIMLARAASPNYFYLLAVLFGLGWGIVMPLLNAVMFDISAARFRGLNINLSLVMMQGSFFLGPFLGGLILTAGGYGFLFYFCCILSMIASSLTVLVRRRKYGEGGVLQ